MKTPRIASALGQLDDDLIGSASCARIIKTSPWKRWGAIAACIALIISAAIVAPLLREEEPGGSGVNPDNRPNIPMIHGHAPSIAPKYYGDAYSIGASGASEEVNSNGISVTAGVVEVLPDVYTFFDDWKQYEYRLLRMRTVKLLKGQDLPEEFYYLVPVAFFTDFLAFDCFVIRDMAQFSYEYFVMYNKTQDEAEQLYLVAFGYRSYGYHLMGENFMAFDTDGNFDERLWQASDAWIEATERAQRVDTIVQVESAIREEEDQGIFVHLLKDISGEAKNALDTIKSFDDGIFVPTFSSSKLYLLPEVQFNSVRYINGFATNERVSVWSGEWSGEGQDSYAHTKARFSEEDLSCLPDLTSAFESVRVVLNNGTVTPPHFNNQEKLRTTTSGVFGWYAKTENGVVGIVRVTWRFCTEKYRNYYDDAYYIIEYGSDECKAIDRDALLELLGDYETMYIYDGKYNENGKEDRVYIS